MEANSVARLHWARQLLAKYPASLVNFTVFTDEKIFMNDRVYAHAGTVSISVSALGTINIHFIEPGIKVNGQYYRVHLLMQKLLPGIHQLSDFYTLQQDSVPAHRARETVELLIMETQSSLLLCFGHKTARI